MDKDENKKKCPLTFNLVGIPSKLAKTVEMRMLNSFCIQNECAWWDGKNCYVETIKDAFSSLIIIFNNIAATIPSKSKYFGRTIPK